MARSVLALAALIGLSAPSLATSEDLRSVAGMAQHNRVLLVFAPDMRDSRLEAQRQAMARFAAGALERDLVFVQVAADKVLGAHDSADTLRRRFRNPPDRYRTVLIGKDGKIARDGVGPMSDGELQRAIDAMPMRQEEMRRARAGQARKED